MYTHFKAYNYSTKIDGRAQVDDRTRVDYRWRVYDRVPARRVAVAALRASAIKIKELHRIRPKSMLEPRLMVVCGRESF